MATEILMWEVKDGKLIPSEISLTEAGRKEPTDLEQWIKSNPKILGDGILIIGEQVQTKKGPLDFLAIDDSGNIIIIELKRDKLPREALAQAIDYASDIASWDIEKLSEECLKYTHQPLEQYVTDNFEKVNWEEISINQFQKILLVGTEVEESLERMIEWLSDKYSLGINVVVLKYTKTKQGGEILARTMILPEDIEKEKSQRQQGKFYAERYNLRKEFWTSLLEKASKKTNLFNNISPSIYSYIGRGAGKSGVSYNFVISYKYNRCEVYLAAGKELKDLNKKRFDTLTNYKEEIEKKFGDKLNWERLDEKDRDACRISFEVEEDTLGNKENWDNIQNKMIDTMIKLESVFKEYIKRLD